MMDECETMLIHISTTLDGEALDEADKQDLKRHLKACPECRALAQQMGQMDAMLRESPLKYAPLGFTERAVEAAYAVEQRRNAWLGGGVLALCVTLFGGLMVTGQRDLFWSALTTMLSPGFSGSTALRDAFESAFVVVNVIGSLMIGPLFLPVTLPLLMILAALTFMQWRIRQGAQSAI